MALFDPHSLDTAPTTDAPAHELAWFAIRQPAVVRFLERRLASTDGDALALGLDLACRLHAAVTLHHGIEPVRIHDPLLRDGLAMAPPPSLTTWVHERCRAAPVVLTDREEAAVAEAIAAVAWALAAGWSTDSPHRWVG